MVTPNNSYAHDASMDVFVYKQASVRVGRTVSEVVEKADFYL